MTSNTRIRACGLWEAPMRVCDVMTKASVTETPTESLTQAATRMWTQQTGSLIVMDGPRLVGIITERDVMKAVARGLDPATTPITEIMTPGVLTVSPATPLNEAARHMASRWIRHLPVVALSIIHISEPTRPY